MKEDPKNKMHAFVILKLHGIAKGSVHIFVLYTCQLKLWKLYNNLSLLCRIIKPWKSQYCLSMTQNHKTGRYLNFWILLLDSFLRYPIVEQNYQLKGVGRKHRGPAKRRVEGQRVLESQDQSEFLIVGRRCWYKGSSGWKDLEVVQNSSEECECSEEGRSKQGGKGREASDKGLRMKKGLTTDLYIREGDRTERILDHWGWKAPNVCEPWSVRNGSAIRWARSSDGHRMPTEKEAKGARKT